MKHPIPTPNDLSASLGILNHRLAYHLGILAAVATEIPKVGATATRQDLEARGWQVNLWDFANNEGFSLIHGDAVVVVFGGTNSKRDWWQNAKVTFPRNHEIGGKVHRGFDNVLNQGLADALALPANANVPLYVTGHSLGGAVATGYAAHLLGSGSPWSSKLRVTTYGSPRLGNEAFETQYESLMVGRHWQYANSKDPITKVPPKTAFGYRHVGKLFYFTKDNILTNPAPMSVGLQNLAAEDRDADEMARFSWLEENESMPEVASEEEFLDLVEAVHRETDAVPDRLSMVEGTLAIGEEGPELQGAVGGWLAPRHSMALYIDNLHKHISRAG